jgi:rubrerythrin
MSEQTLGPVEALKLALNLELEAAAFYKSHAQEGSVARDIFEFLANEEEKHRRLIEKKIQELTVP